MLIREIILENFMSYEYARIPLRNGVNLVSGPNGAGKSSILLGISVALGQSYTERSKKLSDLIRRGKDIGRVTLVLDNSKNNGHRPAPRINKDQIYLTRVLRRDGQYWFELENSNATRTDVLRLLARFGVDPDNMLIIMHQDMVEQFIVLSPSDKLQLVEAAVGLEPYRRNVIEAQKKLSRTVSQEEILTKMLESAEQTLNYWREQYDRYQQKKQLIIKRRFLERELAWSDATRKEQAAFNIQKKINDKNQNLEKTQKTIKQYQDDTELLEKEYGNHRDTLQDLFEERLTYEKEKAAHEYNITNTKDTMEELKTWIQIHQNTALADPIVPIPDETRVVNQTTQRTRNPQNDTTKWINLLNLRLGSLDKSVANSTERITHLVQELKTLKDKTHKTSQEIEETNQLIIRKKVNLAIEEYRKREMDEELTGLNQNHRSLIAELEAATKRAEEMGPRIVSLRTAEEILDEIRMLDGRLAAQSDISGDVERMYESYSKLYLELKDKAQIAAENREKALQEVRTRMDAWRNIVRTLLEHINIQYQKILFEAAASGTVRLIDEHDIEAAGIEIIVGFKGAQPVPLSIYSQSGGERSTATMSFLLALQQRIRSPFRAVDEYDVHMDPKNREVIANLLISVVKAEEAQYLAITPNQTLFEGKDAHMITVQNIEGVSIVKEVS